MKTKISLILLVLMVLLFAGCDQDNILQQTSPEQQTPEAFFSTQQGAVAAVNSTYETLQEAGLYNEDLIPVVGAGTDDWVLNNTWGTSLNNWSFSPEEAGGDRIDVVWQSLYEGGFRSNLVLQNITDIDMDASLNERILGEAHFMRGYFYWHLVTLYGEVPIIREADPNDPSAAEVGKSPINEVNEFVIEDLEQASAMLPRKSDYSVTEMGRATKGAAQTLLGKLYLYNENYSMAETYFDSVITSGEYELLDNYNDVFVLENSANTESIFELQYDASQLGGEGQSGFGWPNGHGGPGNYIPTQDAVDAFEDYTGPSAINGKDPRLFYSIWQQGEPFAPPSEPVYQEDWAPSPGYTIKKGRFPVEETYLTLGSSRNRVLMRLGDVLLLNAEAALMNGDPDKAVGFINDIRNRVDMPTYTVGAMTDQEILDAIVHERRVELMFEYNRLQDLRRWGLAEQELGQLGYESPKHRYFPIPSEEVQTNPELEQNPNY